MFISHAWRYSEGYNRAVRFLNEANNFIWTNYSVPESKAFTGLTSVQLGEQIKAQIRPAQCVVILAGMYVNHSGWIQYEIDFAVSLGKPILGIIPWRAERTPLAVQNSATKMVRWNSADITNGIRAITP
jgi:hypothetical protein